MLLDKFNNYIESYKKLPLVEKKQIVEKELKETLALLVKLHENKGIEENLLFNKEILDVKDGNSSEEDFVEAMFVYILSLQEILGSYIELSENK